LLVAFESAAATCRASDPAFEVETLQGETVTAADLEGQIVVLDFWATWCAPCLERFPEFERLKEKYEDTPGVTFAAINTGRNDPIADVRSFVEKNPLGVRVLYDSSATATDKFDVAGIPHAVILDRSGRVHVRHVGTTVFDFSASMRGHIERLLSSEDS
jgi:thiol-disulfide isomerase/thioredoxin